MAKRKKRVLSPVKRTAASRRIIVASRVESPYGHGTDVVPRVVDTIGSLKSRGFLSEHMVKAAERFAHSFGVVATAGAGGMEPGGGGPRTTLSEQKIAAAEDLGEAVRVLGVRDSNLVVAVVGEGKTIAEASGTNASEFVQRYTGRRLKDALETLADHWYPAATGRQAAASRPERGT